MAIHILHLSLENKIKERRRDDDDDDTINNHNIHIQYIKIQENPHQFLLTVSIH